MGVAAWVGPGDEGGRVPEDFERCQEAQWSIRTAYHRKPLRFGKARMMLKYGKLHGRGPATYSTARTLSLTEGKR